MKGFRLVFFAERQKAFIRCCWCATNGTCKWLELVFRAVKLRSKLHCGLLVSAGNVVDVSETCCVVSSNETLFFIKEILNEKH